MRLKICLNPWIFIIIINFFSVFGENKLVNLKKISYQQGQLTDQITFFFDNTPASIYDPEGRLAAGDAAKFSNYKKAVSFFLPFVNVENNDAKKMISIINEANKNGYKLKIESVVRPLKGLKIYIAYDPEVTNWEYNKLASNNSSRLIFKFYNKKDLDIINQKSSPLRWYAFANHMPKIALDHNLCSQKSEQIFNFKKQLERNGFQVCLINNLHAKGYSPQSDQARCRSSYISHDLVASYCNIIEQPDVYVYLADKINNDRLFVDLNKMQEKIEFVDSCAKIKLNNINADLNLKNQRLELCIMNTVVRTPTNVRASSCLLGFEMPSISIYIDEYLKNNLAGNLISGIIKYFAGQIPENQSRNANVSSKGMKISINEVS